MKMRMIFGALAVAAIALSGCNKVEQTVTTEKLSTGIPFEFVASNASTKTTANDKFGTLWASGDQVNLFHAEAGSTEYVSDGAFKAQEDGASVTFKGELASSLTADKYDWYAIYPYNSNVSTPANEGTKDSYVTVGSRRNGQQTQNGNNSAQHIAGSNYPVAGKVTGVSKDATPEITMSHLTSLIAVNVINDLESNITVTAVSLATESETLVGTYYINFVGDSPVFTDSGTNYVSNTATLQVEDGSEIEQGDEATFYLAVKPFTVASGKTLTLSVTADNGKQTKTKNMSSDVSFEAGKMTTLQFSYTLPEVDYDWLTNEKIGMNSDSGYTDWSDIKGNYTDAVYAGNSNKNTNGYIQIRAQSPAGIVSTTSGGYLKKVVANWNSSTPSERTLTVYGKNAPYGSAADLYDENLRGTEIGTIVNGSTEISATEYFAYVGIISNGAVYLDEVDFYWGEAKEAVEAPTDVKATVDGTNIIVSWTDAESENVSGYIVTCTDQAPQVISKGTTSATFGDLVNDTYTVTVQAVPANTSLDSGSYAYSEITTITDLEVTAAATEVWKLTDIADITSTDVFVIVGTNGTASYAMTNANGTSLAPSAEKVTIVTEGGVSTLSGSVKDNVKWRLVASSIVDEGDNSIDGYIFYAGKEGTDVLYCTDANNGVRVGTNTNNSLFTISDQGYLFNDATSRYVGVYISSDWRCYTSINNNIKDQTFTFYVLQGE